MDTGRRCLHSSLISPVFSYNYCEGQTLVEMLILDREGREDPEFYDKNTNNTLEVENTC